MCKIYYYVWNVSYTASIIILTAIAVERYIAIIYPLKAKYFRRRRILLGILLLIWMVALVYNVPYLIFYDTLSFVSLNIEYCYFYHRNLSGLQGLSLANLIVWYILPLCVIGAMYIIIGTTLWKTQSQASTMYLRKCNSVGSSKSPSQDSAICDVPSQDQQSHILDNGRSLRHENNTSSTQLINEHSCDSAGKYTGQRQRNSTNKTIICKRSPLNTKTESRKINGERRKVIRLLVAVVASFAVCVLPHHLRVLNHFWNIVNLPHSVEVYFAPVSFLVLYLNSCLNPILYALFSSNFRKAFKESLTCLKSLSRRQIKSKYMSSHSVV